MNIAGPVAYVTTLSRQPPVEKLTIARSHHLTRRHAGATRDRGLWIPSGIDVFEGTPRSSVHGAARCVTEA